MNEELKKSRLRILISFIFFICAIVVPYVGYPMLKIVLYLIAYLIVGIDVLKEAILNIPKGKIFDENFLMSLATIVAFAIKEYPEAVMVMWLFQVGEFFQKYAVGKSKKAIKDLIDVRPDYANVEREGNLVEIFPEEVKIGEVILVKAGEKIPLDGVVIDGESMLDTKALTGEAIPRKVSVNNEVFSGCINITGVLKIRVSKKFEESTVYKILELVENADSNKAKSENFISKFAKYYTPIVVISALLLAIIPPLFIEGAYFNDYIYRACSFLVISCPCALVISIPLTFFCGIGGASRQGILIKGSNYIDILAKAKTVVFDKTGTLTKGNFKVIEVNNKNIEKDELIKLAAYAEFYSTHPIATAIKEYYNKTIDSTQIGDVNENSGKGITANVDGKKVYVGNEKLMNEIKVGYTVPIEKNGTVIHISIDNEYNGNIVIADEIKAESYDLISKLKNKNRVKSTIMLTGDYKKIAENVGNELAIDKVYAELLPNEKVEKIKEIMNANENKSPTIFVGDGINDAPVIAYADIGIAMGGLGSDATIEAADVVIMDDDISKVSTAISLSKKILRIVKQNIVLIISVKLIELTRGALGTTDMWQAVFADVGVLFIAVLNAIRAMKNRI